MEDIATLILFFLLFVWILLILIGLGFITDKIFNLITVTTTCPNVDMTVQNNNNGIQYAKINYPTTITQGVYNTIDTSNTDQMNFIKISLVSLWILIGLFILIGIPLLMSMK
jgi:hypothetical protein